MPAPPAPPAAPAGLSASAGDLIRDALLEIQAIAVGELPTNAESQDGLRTLNRMLDAWQAQRLNVFATQRLLLPLQIGVQTYQLGSSSTTAGWSIARPARIDYGGVVVTTEQPQPLEVALTAYTESDWLQIPVKAIESALPQGYWDDQGFPFRNISFWPIPNVSGLQFACYSWVALQQFSDLLTPYGWPPGYMEAIVKNLALRLAPQYPGNASQLLLVQAQQALAVLKSSNQQPVLANTDPALVPARGGYNWITDNANLRGGY